MEQIKHKRTELGSRNTATLVHPPRTPGVIRYLRSPALCVVCGLWGRRVCLVSALRGSFLRPAVVVRPYALADPGSAIGRDRGYVRARHYLRLAGARIERGACDLSEHIKNGKKFLRPTSNTQAEILQPRSTQLTTGHRTPADTQRFSANHCSITLRNAKFGTSSAVVRGPSRSLAG